MSGVELCNIRDVWYHNLEKFPRKTAAICEGRALTYGECDRLTDRLHRALVKRFGVSAGTTVAIAAPNDLEYFLVFWALMKCGAVAVPVNTRLGPPELRHVIDSCRADVLFVHRSCWRRMTDAAAGRPFRFVIGIAFDEEGVVPFEALLEDEGGPVDATDIRGDDLAIVMYTSGTTGVPKGATMRHADLLFNNRLAIYAHSLRHEDVNLLVVPMFHATALYSLVPTSALLGSTLVIAPRSDLRQLLDAIQQHRVTTFFGVPMMFRLLSAMADLSDWDLSSLRLIAYAGSPMPPPTIRRLRQLLPGVALHNFFGLTETISMTHVLADADADTHPDSIGKLLPHVSQRILDDSGQEAAPGEVGALHLHRSNVIGGYWGEPDRLDGSMRGEWFDTGDLASVDVDGFVYLKGRRKDMIIVGGENVYATEVENCIAQDERVAEVAVVGIPATGMRAYMGELVKAFVVTRPGEELSAADVKRHCAGRLATYKVPQEVEFRTELPRNTAGKIMKRLLR